MKILTVLTYYHPHISGLTIYARRLCHALVERGHEVTVLTSQYDPELPRKEDDAGVRVIRVPVAMRISKGVIMPTIGWHATRQVLDHDLIHLHLPQFDAPGIALRGWLFKKPVVLTYHCDLTLPPSLFHTVVTGVVNVLNRAAVSLADTVVTNTEEFARFSPLLSRQMQKVCAIAPPVTMLPPQPTVMEQLRGRFHIPAQGPVIGIVARLSAEKGIEYLLGALPLILERFPGAVVCHVGPREPVGEAEYAQRIGGLLEKNSGIYRFLGTVTDEELAAFFALCDVNVLPSTNSTESFGMVQVEAALCGTPTVASDLPGVRVANQMTGMGLVVPPRDSWALADAICKVIDERERFVRPAAALQATFSPAVVAGKYEEIFLKRK